MVSVIDLLILSQIPMIGPQRLRALVSRFGETKKILALTARECAGVEGFNRRLASTVASFLRSRARTAAEGFASRQLSRLNAVGGTLISLWDAAYPDLLKRIYDPPTLLFMRGAIIPDDHYALAIVGTRSPSAYGAAITASLVRELSRLGLCVVSGLARGIDTEAHRTALSCGGRTLAVIGSGIDVIYPPENRRLAESVSRHGAVLSEYAMGTKPDAGNFPRRNRIISGLCPGTIVVETDVNGGALITAASALDQNREVFAVPGRAGESTSRGCHLLIKSGRAKLVETVDDILSELRLPERFAGTVPHGREHAIVQLSLFEQTVLQGISSEPRQVDAIAASASMAPSDVLVHLLSLEFKGLIRQLPGKMFIRM